MKPSSMTNHSVRSPKPHARMSPAHRLSCCPAIVSIHACRMTLSIEYEQIVLHLRFPPAPMATMMSRDLRLRLVVAPPLAAIGPTSAGRFVTLATLATISSDPDLALPLIRALMASRGATRREHQVVQHCSARNDGRSGERRSGRWSAISGIRRLRQTERCNE